MKYVAVLMIALLAPAAALAKGECDADREKFCKDIEGEAELKACIQQHFGEMSKACQARMAAKANKNKEKTGEEESSSKDDKKQ
jgi:hypothetical protein